MPIVFLFSAMVSGIASQVVIQILMGVIGGQLFSKSFRRYTTCKMGFATREGLLIAVALLILSFLVLWGQLRLLPPWEEQKV